MMATFKVILWDIDGTILNFLAAEKEAVKKCFQIFGIGECTDEMIERYSAINVKYWKMLERGEITKKEVLIGRYKEFFSEEGIDITIAEKFNEEYQLRLGDTIVFCENAYELIEELGHSVKQYGVTNGTFVAQKRKLTNSGLDKLLEHTFISDNLGYEKPAKEFFDIVLNEIGDYEKDEILIVGDSLTSDILGGINAGIKTCWYNPEKKKNSDLIIPTYEIASLEELKGIIKFMY